MRKARNQGRFSVETVVTACFKPIGGLTPDAFLRRFTRLSLGSSKKLTNLIAAVSLHFAYYNYCWMHGSLTGTPAMAAGIAGLPGLACD
jgi:hypothetical protein